MVFRHFASSRRNIALGLIVVPMVASLVWLHVQRRRMAAQADQTAINLGLGEISRDIEVVTTLCQSQQESTRASLLVAHQMILGSGAAELRDEKVTWKAVDPLSRKTTELTLPAMTIAGRPIEVNADLAKPSPTADETQRITGYFCTVFQRMNPQGDMLRVCTNVPDGPRRAVGTYISATEADGKSNPVIAAALSGRAWTGRAFVVDEWYVASYEPIRDGRGEIIGMLFVGMPERLLTGLWSRIGRARSEQSHAAFVLDAYGNLLGGTKGEYVGRPITQVAAEEERDAMKGIEALAKSIAPGQTAEYEYSCRDKGTSEDCIKVCRITRLKDWDWVVVVEADSDDLYAPHEQVLALNTTSSVALAAVSALSLIALVMVWRLGSRAAGKDLSAVVEAIPDPFLVVDRQFRVVLANKSARDLCGKDPVAAGLRCHQISHHSEVPCVGEDEPCPVLGVFETGKPVRVTHVHRDAAGEPIFVDVSSSPIFDERGRVQYAVEVCRDYTPLKRVTEDLEFRNVLLSTQQEASIDGILVVDTAGQIRSFNRRFVSLWGIPEDVIASGRDELAIQSVLDKLSDPPGFVEEVQRLYAHPDQVSRDEIALKDGRTFDRYSAPMLAQDGRCFGRVWLFRDITDRQQAEQDIRRESAKLSAMISGMEEGVVFADASGVIVEANDYICRLTGKDRAELLGRTLEELHTPVLMARIGALTEAFRLNPGSPARVVQRPLAGREVILRIQPIYRDGAYDGVLLNVVDVTELVTARRMAEDASRAKSEFLANMSHEIRTPMTAILGYADMLDDPGADESGRRECLATIRRNGSHLLGLINEILDLSKVEAGKMVVEKCSCDVGAIVRDVSALAGASARAKGLRFDVEWDEALPHRLLSDGARLRQALFNLADNAVKFTHAGRVCLKASLVSVWREAGPALRVEVTDTGIGIAPEALKKLFEPFMQADASMHRKYGGTGLGLAITRRIAELLGGELLADSVPGRGSTFTMTVPIEPVGEVAGPEELPPVPVAVPVSGENPLAGVRVLLAEDGPDNQRLLGWMLRKAGATVDVVDNGARAVEKVLAAPGEYHVILMDVQMPEMDGYQATAALRQSGYTGPVVALTAHAMAEDRGRSIDAGCNEHLTKPVDRALLIERVLAWSGLARQAQAPAPAPTEDSEAVLCSQLADDPELADILGDFLAGLDDKVRAMQEALAHNAFTELTRLAHQLKGAAGGYGYPSITDVARTLEADGKAGDAEGAALALAEVARLCRAAARSRCRKRIQEGV